MLPALADDLQQVVAVAEGRNPDLGETVAERGRQLLLAEVAARVHGGDNVEAWVRYDGRVVDVNAALLCENQSAPGLENRVQTLQNRVVRERHFVKEQEFAVDHGMDQRAVDPLEQRRELLDLALHATQSRLARVVGSGLQSGGDRIQKIVLRR